MPFLALTPEHFQELDTMARTMAGRVIEVIDYRRNESLNEKTFAAIPGLATDVILDMHETSLRGHCCGGIWIKNLIDTDRFHATQRPEMDWRAIPVEDIYRFIVLHEVGHCLRNYDYDWWWPYGEGSIKYQLRRTVLEINEVLADRYAWESLYPGKALPVRRGRKTAIKESMKVLDRHFKMKDFKKRQLPEGPAKFVPISHEKDGIPFVVPESLEEGESPRTEYLRPWEAVMKLPA